MRKAKRQSHAKGRAFARLAFHVDRAAVKLDQLIDQRETDAGAFVRSSALSFDSMKALKQAGQFFRRNAYAGVAHRKLYMIADRTKRHADAAFQREFERVR